MISWKKIHTALLALVAWISLGGLGKGEAICRMSTAFVARGEQATLEVAITGGTPVGAPQIVQPQFIKIQEAGLGPGTQMLPGRQIEYVYQYRVLGYEVGKYTIPPIKVNIDGVITQTAPVEFEIFNPDELHASEVELEGRKIRYYSSFRSLNATPYENETTPAEIKLFMPVELKIQDWGIPDFERDGLAAWRFQPSRQLSIINLLGIPHYSISYPSTITPTRTGKISIGPAKIRLVTQDQIMDPFPKWVNLELYVQVPKLEMEVLPLPDGAPEGFENAVGSFQISATTATTEVQEGDPISVDLVVTGSGNLDTLSPPKLSPPAGWKVYSTTTEQRGDERRDLSGNVVFHQSIRPLEMKSEIPPFKLVYFDPRAKIYQTLTTAPIPLRMIPISPSATEQIVQPLPVPFERMNDILALIRPAQLTVPVASSFPAWIGHAIGAVLALALAAKALWMRFGSRFRKNPGVVTRSRELQEIVSAKSPSDTEFLRAAGGFIERHLGRDPSPAILAVLAERDAVCFRSEKPQAVLDHKRRDEIVRLLRAVAMCLLFIFTLSSGNQARAADIATQATEAFDSAKYDQSIKLWLSAGEYDELSADTLYDIGNACYRSGSPGYAALYYRRALVRDSGHQEARQNLRFIERKYGSIAVSRPDYQFAIAKYPISSWKTALWLGLWLCGLALLVFPATRPGARIRWAAAGGLVIGPVLFSAGLLGWRYFPNDAEFAPRSRQAVVIAENVSLHTDAARTAPEVIDAPPGSLCEVIRESERWVYVGFATKTRGWVLKESIEMVQPTTPPEPPKFRKVKGDGKSA
jgi:hypothetical protein